MDEIALNLFKALSEELNPSVLQRKFLVFLLKLYEVDRGSIWIKEKNTYLCIEAAGRHGEDITGFRIPADRPSIVGWVIENGRLTVSEPQTDRRHLKKFEDNLAVKSRLILCFPLFLKNGNVYGAVQIIDTDAGKSALNVSAENLEGLQRLIDAVSIPLSNALRFDRQSRETEDLKQKLKLIRSQNALIGQSACFRGVKERIRSYAKTDYPVLIIGESGTGKELAARRLHDMSPRKHRPFIVQNCSAIPETLLESELFGYRKGAFSGAATDKKGLFEAADGGTLFLDEIGDMPLRLQPRILRVLQNNEIKPLGDTRTRRVNVRMLSATNHDMQKMTAQGEFRLDLYYRLSVLPLQLPPLRERWEDVPLLAIHFLTKESLVLEIPVKTLQRSAMEALTAYSWPGNVRELENLIRYLLVTVPRAEIGREDLPAHIREGVPGNHGDTTRWQKETPGNPLSMPNRENPRVKELDGLSWEQMERLYVLSLLKKCHWNITRAAEKAGLNRSTFSSRLRRLKIKKGSESSG